MVAADEAAADDEGVVAVAETATVQGAADEGAA